MKNPSKKQLEGRNAVRTLVKKTRHIRVCLSSVKCSVHISILAKCFMMLYFSNSIYLPHILDIFSRLKILIGSYYASPVLINPQILKNNLFLRYLGLCQMYIFFGLCISYCFYCSVFAALSLVVSGGAILDFGGADGLGLLLDCPDLLPPRWFLASSACRL